MLNTLNTVFICNEIKGVFFTNLKFDQFIRLTKTTRNFACNFMSKKNLK